VTATVMISAVAAAFRQEFRIAPDRHARESGHPVIAAARDRSRRRGVLDRPPSRTMTEV
jgi:hypothetical protein